MEIIINELSLHNQFSSFEDFRINSLLKFLKILRVKPKNVEIFKKSDIYSREVYNSKTLHGILISRDVDGKSDEIKKLKLEMSKIINDPYWDNDKKCDSKYVYLIEDNNVNETCFAEAFERDCSVISFCPSIYEAINYWVSKEEIQKNVFNFFDNFQFAKNYYESGHLSFYEFCLSCFSDTKINFSRVIKSQSFDLIKDKNDENEFYNSFDMFSSLEWDSILKQGGKGKNKAGLAYRKFHDQAHFSQYKKESDICKFSATGRFRVFGYREGEIFYVLAFDLTHELSD
ncbi:hypothetical protein [Flavobacterium sp. HTF]|uniref:hypothetical protein n=1 Tax=Flavobacterium sp. HTF TaxID=2170732 RepID=UPI000D5F494F|nr:hypothetical protein [Flavobacterium sp. HTF]PWB25931.1 hypothetical protein DCO46_07755 [Flavobacterium sp. HTF]